MIPFNFHHLYYFYSVARHGSMSKAAEELRVSQPALSAQLKQLESFLGIRLFEREKRKLVLTEEGRTALSYAHTIFDAGREFMDSLQDTSQKGRIRIQIGVTNSVGKVFANTLVKLILKISPSAHILLKEDTLESMVENLRDHRLDIVLSDVPYQASAEEGIRNRLAGRIPVVFCAHPRFSASLKRFPESLQNVPIILPTAHSGVYQALQEFFSQHKLSPRIVAEIQDTELIHRMALDGIGIAPLNKYSVQQGTFKGSLMILPRQPKHDIHETIYLISKERKKHNPLVGDILGQFRIQA